MHELAITQSIVEACCERAGDARVSRVLVEVGCLSGVSPDALRFCYDLCVEGTPLDGSELAIVEIPAGARCRSCGQSERVDGYSTLCRCGSSDLEYTGGDELRVKYMEVQ